MGGKHKKCKSEDCKLIASFGYNKQSGTEFCSKHKNEGMINLLCKLCSCGTSRPTYNYEGLSANFCKKCKTEDMINVNGEKCHCGKARPTFNFQGLKPEYCAKCRLEGMINVKDSPCKCGRTTKPTFNYAGLKPAFCKQCKSDGMIDIYRKKCKCNKSQPSFNYDGLNPEYCAKCKLEGMVNIIKRVCVNCNINQASFNYMGLKPKYCSTCKDENMINISDKCKNEHCTNSGNIKYRYHCTFCFQHLFPNDPLTKNIRFKTKEVMVQTFLNEHFNFFIHDHPMWTGDCDCSHRRRIDHRALIGNTLLCIETDENQHKRYNSEDEEIRYDDLYMIHGGKFIFIRFNPDKYNDKYDVCQNPSMEYRFGILKREIEYHIDRIKNEENQELVEINYLFYDEEVV
jgi:hypothetical protein